jgi:quercetin dioxygenase-like cupin family protein
VAHFDQTRRTLQIFRGGEAEDFHETGMMESRVAPAAREGIARMYEAGLAEGYVLKCLFRSPDPNGFSLSYAWFKPHHALPPHSHSSDCLYYVISGSLFIGDQVLRSGDGFFLPSGALYAYQAGPEGVEVLEFRDRSSFDISIGEGSPRGWERLVKICRDNQLRWRNAPMPVRDVQWPAKPPSGE